MSECSVQSQYSAFSSLTLSSSTLWHKSLRSLHVGIMLTESAVEQLAIQQQIDMLQQQQQQIAATHQQYVNMGVIQPQMGAVAGYSPVQNQVSTAGLSPPSNAFQFPQVQQQLGSSANASAQAPSHRRNQSALPSMAMGPPPAPSSGASGSTFSEYNQQTPSQNRESGSSRGRGSPAGSGHNRRHSLALPEAKKAAELAQQKRTTTNFQFPGPGSSAPSSAGLPGVDDSSAVDDNSTATPSQHLQGLGLQRAGNVRGGGHGRSQSLAVGNGRGAAAVSRGAAGFQFPSTSGAEGGLSPQSAQTEAQRRATQQGHVRSGSRNFEGNWRQQTAVQGQTQDQPQQYQGMGNFGQAQNANTVFQPSHRARASMNQPMGSLGALQYSGQPPLLQVPQNQVVLNQSQIPGGQQLNSLHVAQLHALQNAQISGQSMGLSVGQQGQPQVSLLQQQQQQQQQQQSQQRKTLFTPYLPQASLPALLNDGQLVAGILRVNKKNRSDAYVTTSDLDADIFICGSKDRNRALEGDLVAVELLDVDGVWGQKREKEEKKKRKDITDTRTSGNGDKPNRNDSQNSQNTSMAPDGSIKRRGSLRQRPTQKRNDDVEVEGQSLLLIEEEEISDEQKPLYAGHVVAVIERIAGQMFSGTLGLLRPSSQATKEKQEAERQARDGDSGRHHHERQQEKPKIVWFKPTDKRVPLIAIPTEQAPRDFVEKHQEYATRIFVACIKRWPITSLHPFGTLVEQLGEMGDLRVETDALLRDNNFASDEFADAVVNNVGFEDWSLAKERKDSLATRRDFRAERTFTIDSHGSKELDDAIHLKKLGNGKLELGIHVADIAHFVKANSVVDREAKKRGTGVFLMNRTVSMLPPRLTTEICSLVPNEARLTVSVVFEVDAETGIISEEPWIGKGIIESVGKLAYEEVDAIIQGKSEVVLQGATADDIKSLRTISDKFREQRYGNRSSGFSSLRLLYQLDDENVPVEQNIFTSSASHEIIEELSHRANMAVAQKIFAAMPENAFLRRHASPNARRLATFAERMARAGFDVDITSSGALQNSLFKVQDAEFRQGMEVLLLKTMQRAKYYVPKFASAEQRQHFALNLPLYTHFTSPMRRYADIVVHRQLEAILSDDETGFNEDAEALAKTAEQCNTKKDSAQAAQEQSVHIESCRLMDKKRQKQGSALISEGIVICVYESAFDVLLPEYGFEKRVHCDQLPLKKAEYRKEERVLELYWEKDIPSSAYIPEEEKADSKSKGRLGGKGAAQGRYTAKQAARPKMDMSRRQTEPASIPTDDADALFAEDDDLSEITESAAGVSLNSSVDQEAGPVTMGGADPESTLTDIEKYRGYFDLREVGGEHIQDVTEMKRVPVILSTDLSKSPP